MHAMARLFKLGLCVCWAAFYAACLPVMYPREQLYTPLSKPCTLFPRFSCPSHNSSRTARLPQGAAPRTCAQGRPTGGAGHACRRGGLFKGTHLIARCHWHCHFSRALLQWLEPPPPTCLHTHGVAHGNPSSCRLCASCKACWLAVFMCGLTTSLALTLYVLHESV